MKKNTKLFGTINVNEGKIITLENGLIGFPDNKEYILIFDEDQKKENTITWLQSLDSEEFAIPVMNPLLIKQDYNPFINDELLKPLGELTKDNTCVLVTVTVPKDIKHMAVNLKAPLIINTETRKGSQLIVEDDYQVHFEIYDFLKALKAEKGE